MTIQYHADKVNETFKDSNSNYVNLDQRLDQSFDTDNNKKQLKTAAAAFVRNNANIKSWQDFEICKVSYTTFDKIIIDTTLQRNVLVYWLCYIISHFVSIRVMPIQVYEHPDHKGKYICWDGQHTVLMLFVIATRVFNQDPSQIQIPIIIYPSHKRSDMRDNFLVLNTKDGKKEVGNSEKWRQWVLSVRADFNKEPDRLRTELKQQALERTKLFVTEQYSSDSCMPGAITNMSELLKYEYTPEIIDNIGSLLLELGVQNTRPLTSTEMWQFGPYFMRCKSENILVDTAYIRTMAATLGQILSGYTSDKLHDKAKKSYDAWYVARPENVWGNLWGTQWGGETRKDLHREFLSALMAYHTKLKVPSYNLNWGKPEDLEID